MEVLERVADACVGCVNIGQRPVWIAHWPKNLATAAQVSIDTAVRHCEIWNLVMGDGRVHVALVTDANARLGAGNCHGRTHLAWRSKHLRKGGGGGVCVVFIISWARP